MSLATPYRSSKQTDKVEKYKEKLKQRTDNQNWILNNYFGKPGAGAPLKDRAGHLITKIKTIADGNIYILPSKDFTKVDEESIIKDHSQINPHQQLYNDDYNRMLQQQQLNDYQSQLQQLQPSQYNPYTQMPSINNPYNNPQLMSSQSFPYLPTYPFYYPIIIQQNPQQINSPFYPLSSQHPNTNKSMSLSDITEHHSMPHYNDNITNNTNNNLFESHNKNNNNNQIITYALPQANDKKEIQDRDIQKQLWKKELLIQIEEKKQRETNQKKSLIEQDKAEELKYQEYLRIKKDQAEQQDLKRKNKIRKMITQLNESGDYEQKQQLESIIESSANKQPSPKQFNNHNNKLLISNSNNIKNNMLLLPNITDDEYKNQHEFKNFIDSQYIGLNQSLKEDFDLEMKKMQHDSHLKYNPNVNVEQRELIGQLNDHPTQLTNNQIYNEKRLRHIQDMIEQRKLVDYVLNKDKIGNVPPFNREVDIKIPSFFGQNKDDQSKYVNLQSSSSFIYDNKASFEDQKVNSYLDIMNNKQAKQTSVCVERSLDNVSTFQPFNEEVQHQKIRVIPSNIEAIRNDDHLFQEMFGKLDDIAELSKNIDKTLKYKAIHGGYEIDLINNQVEQ